MKSLEWIRIPRNKLIALRVGLAVFNVLLFVGVLLYSFVKLRPHF